MSYLIFISHSGEDTWIAKKIATECQAVGADTFLDEAQIAIGAQFERDILEALRQADEFIVLVTPWALQRPYVWLEIGAAWLRGIPIVILLLGITAAEFQERANIPVVLKERNLLSLNNADRYFTELSDRVAQQRERS